MFCDIDHYSYKKQDHFYYRSFDYIIYIIDQVIIIRLKKKYYYLNKYLIECEAVKLNYLGIYNIKK